MLVIMTFGEVIFSLFGNRESIFWLKNKVRFLVFMPFCIAIAILLSAQLHYYA